MSELLPGGLEIKRSGSTASVHSEATTYEFYSDGEFDKAEEYAKETLSGPSLSQPVSGSSSSTQPVNSTPSSTDSVLSSKRKLEVLFDTESDVISSTSSSSLKLPKLADSRFNSGSNLHQDSSEASRPYVIDHMGFRSFFGLAPCGFYWELAIQISNGMKAQEIPHLELRKSLLGKKSNVEVAPTVSQVIEEAKRKLEEGKPKRKTFHDPMLVKAFDQEMAAKMPWKELDREEEHECRNKAATDPSDLYFMDRSEGWYGGKVHFAAKLSKDELTSKFSLILQKPFLGSSNRFTRRFGSKRFIRVRISDKDFYNDTGGKIRTFFHRPFVIFGRVFRAFFAKDHSVFLVQTNECCEKDPYTKEWLITAPDSDTGNDQYNLSFFDFLNWHNPLNLNTDQPMAKWAARFALGLSNSVPGVRIAKEDYFVIDDVVAEAYVGKKKVPAEYTMTDGCGLANGDFFAALAENLSSEFRVFSTAVQVRINGAKGLLTIHPDHISPTPEKRPKVWIRESQRKIQYEEDDADVAHYIVDILRYARMSTPSQLSTETIINMAENGVPAEALAALMREWFQDRVSKLTTWDGPNGLFKLWKNVCREGRVIAARLARENPGSARARGLVTDDVDDEVVDGECMEDDELEELVAGKSKAWWEDAISGQPSSLEETCAGLLDAGFSPDTCSLLRTKLFEVAKKAVESSKTKYRIRVPLSCTAFVIPDPVGVLEPGECHIKFSSRRVKDRNGIPTDAILGPVLLTRHPCKVPTDVQKATAVVKYELRHYVDVIIVSTKGHIVNNQRLDRHLASMTGGGDYDGDLMSAFWQPELLEHFKPADPRFADEPSTVEKCLVKSQTTVTEFLGNEEGREISLDQKISRLQEHLLAPLKDASIVGKYSKYWENSIYANGYSHEETVRLAYIFCQVLDGTKTGVSIVQQIWDKDSRAYNRPPPEWKVSLKTKESQYDNPSNLAAIRRGEGLERFIMDILGDEVRKESAKQLKHIEEKLGDKPDMPPDEDLRRPWKMFHAKVAANDPELGPYMSKMKSSIEEHVRTVFDNWEKRRRPKQGQKARRFTDRPITERQDSLRLCSQEFASGPDPSATRMHDTDSVARLKASYAYILAYDKRKHRFAFDVAYRTLCAIKAQAVSNNTEKTVTANFYARMDLHKLAIDDD